MGAEVELKLVTSKAALRKAMALPWLRKMAGNGVDRRTLVSVYFDTAKGALRRHGVSLRVRKIGEHRLQTIKANSAAPLERAEWESEIDRDEPRLELARGTALAPLLTDKLRGELKPVFETRVERVAMPLHIGDSAIELAFDAGRVSTADAAADLVEIEIELKQGDRRDVARLAKRLARSVPMTFGPQAKAERGYALAQGALDAPVSAQPVTLAPDCTVADAFIIVGFSCLRHFAANQAAVRNGDGEGIHQMRVGLRRLRAALSVFKEMLRGADARAIKAELKWVTAQLGPARDYDVFISEAVAPRLADHERHHVLQALRHDLETARDEAFEAARAAVQSERFRRLLLDCALWLLDGDWRNDKDALARALRARPATAFARDELARRTKKIARRVRRLDRLDLRRRHRLRIAVKKLRYAREFFAGFDSGRRHGKAGRKMDRALKALQSSLGRLNDMRVHARLADELARARLAPPHALALGGLIGREEAGEGEALTDALAAGKRLRRAV